MTSRSEVWTQAERDLWQKSVDCRGAMSTVYKEIWIWESRTGLHTYREVYEWLGHLDSRLRELQNMLGEHLDEAHTATETQSA